MTYVPHMSVAFAKTLGTEACDEEDWQSRRVEKSFAPPSIDRARSTAATSRDDGRQSKTDGDVFLPSAVANRHRPTASGSGLAVCRAKIVRSLCASAMRARAGQYWRVHTIFATAGDARSN